jgi:serine/threonine protein kinase
MTSSAGSVRRSVTATHLEREIGAGGMATVYLARDIRHRRRVALKVVRPDLGGPLALERFLREIELAARLQHPTSFQSSIPASSRSARDRQCPTS